MDIWDFVKLKLGVGLFICWLNVLSTDNQKVEWISKIWSTDSKEAVNGYGKEECQTVNKWRHISISSEVKTNW